MRYWQQGVVELGQADKFRQLCLLQQSFKKVQFINLRFLAPKSVTKVRWEGGGATLTDDCEKEVKMVQEGLAVWMVVELQ